MKNFIFRYSYSFFSRPISGSEIKGKVLDEGGLALPGVTIDNLTSGSNSISDLDGNFSIKANEGEQLKFTYLGYVAQTSATSQGMSISLQPSSTDLSEVVVVGYGTQKDQI